MTRAATCSRRSCSARASRSLVGLARRSRSRIVLGVSLGLIAGYVGGKLDAFIMRVADVQLSFPAILIALLIDGVARVVLPRDAHVERRAVRADPRDRRCQLGAIRAHRPRLDDGREEQGIRAGRARDRRLAARHHARATCCPTSWARCWCSATINIATAIITEATLSFLGVGVPPTQPSLGTLIRVGNDFLFSGEWWITDLSGRRAGDHGARDQPARRLDARRAQPEIAVTGR